MSEGLRLSPRDEQAPRCVYCRESPGSDTRRCEGCGAVYHAECQDELRQRARPCATPGCGGAAPLPGPPPTPAEPPSRPRRPRPEDFGLSPRLADPIAPPRAAPSAPAALAGMTAAGPEPAERAARAGPRLSQAVFVTGLLLLGLTTVLGFRVLILTVSIESPSQLGALEAARSTAWFAGLASLTTFVLGALVWGREQAEELSRSRTRPAERDEV